ncbi:hypothetical protein [Owenweeksia hongkongensis]|uniref:hypothetical protein n=1 Tax=Owenweeksia hongkongensis TaxID=253245 RepID=UPI003A94C5AD
MTNKIENLTNRSWTINITEVQDQFLEYTLTPSDGYVSTIRESVIETPDYLLVILTVEITDGTGTSICLPSIELTSDIDDLHSGSFESAIVVIQNASENNRLESARPTRGRVRNRVKDDDTKTLK